MSTAGAMLRATEASVQKQEGSREALKDERGAICAQGGAICAQGTDEDVPAKDRRNASYDWHTALRPSIRWQGPDVMRIPAPV